MFTFASTITAVSVGAGFSTMSCAVYGEPCNPCFDYEVDSSTVDDGGNAALYGLADAQLVDDAAPDASDASFIEDASDAGEDAD